MSTYYWIAREVPEALEIRQVYGFIFDIHGSVLLLEDEGEYNLPGGKPEKDESLSETLVREIKKEAQLTIIALKYLGYQLVIGEEEFAQVRFAARIGQIYPSAPDPSTGRPYSRLWVPPMQANAMLLWGNSGDQQIASAIAASSHF